MKGSAYIVSIHTACGIPVADACPVMKIPRVHEQQIHILLLRNLLHMRHEAREVAQVSTK